MNREEARKKAEALVAQMDVLEAAAQLRYDAPALDRLHIPEYNWWNEALHGVARAGVATSFPQAIGMAAAFDPDMVERLGDIAATEGRAKYNAFSRKDDRDIYKGLTFWSPNINIFRDPRWGRGHETYGEDPYLTARLGLAYIRGLQGSGEFLKSAACAKHFAVHSGPEAERHRFDVHPSKKDMEETYLPAFEVAVKQGDVEAVMGAYNAVNGYPCCGSPELLQGYLREKWGFQGHVVSDCWAVNDFHEHHHFTDTPAESSAAALKAGTDLNCGCTYRCLITALAQKLISEDDIRRAAVRLFTTRYLLGIMDGQQTEYDRIPYSVVECKEHVSAALEAAEKGIVLLKNDGVLPLRKEKLNAIAVVGPNANSRVALVGNYHGTSSRYITVLEGIQDEVGEDVRVYYSEGCHLFKERTENLAHPGDRISEALIAADQSDVVVLVLGLDETLEGEEGDTGNADASGDKLSLLLPQSQRDLAQAVLGCGKPVILNENGKLMQDNLRRTRVTLDELTGHLREKDVLDITAVQYAILETDGNLSVFPFPKERPASAKDAGIHPKPQFLPVTIVEDGFLSRENLGRAGKDEAWLKQVLQEHRAEIADTLLLTVDAGNKVVWLGKEYGR